MHGKNSDEYLTPPDLVKALGPFSLDPCTPVNMPWKTASTMFNKKDDGLAQEWGDYGRIWLNPPYSNCAPWIKKFVEHKNGIALVSAKSTDCSWGQLLLRECHSALWLSGRISFWRLRKIHGSKNYKAYQTKGKFLSNLLVAMTDEDTLKLLNLIKTYDYPGVLMSPVFNRKIL